MKTREQIYGEEANEILRIITDYHYIRHDQLIKLFEDKESKIDNLLSYFKKQGRIFHDSQTDIYSDGSSIPLSYELISALWVLTDFVGISDYHTASDFPVMLIFVVNGEMYEVIYAATEKEALITHALLQSNTDADKRLVIIENTEQIEKLKIPNVAAYCIVNNETGNVKYFRQRKEEDIG